MLKPAKGAARRELLAKAPPPWERPHRDAIFTSRVAALLARNERYVEVTHEAGALDFDPLLAAQDFDDDVLHDLVIEAETQGQRVQVRARFSNGGGTTVILFDVALEGGKWLIDDIHTAEWSVSRILESTPYCAPGWTEPCRKTK